jgi:hypothetical protein
MLYRNRAARERRWRANHAERLLQHARAQLLHGQGVLQQDGRQHTLVQRVRLQVGERHGVVHALTALRPPREPDSGLGSHLLVSLGRLEVAWETQVAYSDTSCES